MLSPAVTPPVSPTPAEEIAEAIDRIGPLHGLPLEDRLWLAHHGHELIASAGEVLFEEGAPAEQMMLILKGEIHVRRKTGGPMALFIGRTGQMTGLLPFSRMKGYGGQGFAASPVWALFLHKSLFPALSEAKGQTCNMVLKPAKDNYVSIEDVTCVGTKHYMKGKIISEVPLTIDPENILPGSQTLTEELEAAE